MPDNEHEQVHFRIEFSVDRRYMDGSELSWDEFVAWLREEYDQGAGKPGVVALIADFIESPCKVSLRYRTDVAEWQGMP